MPDHTPGPWTALRCEHGWHVGPQPDGVCSVSDNSDGSEYEEHEANARLIAAAPDLLAACEAWVAYLSPHTDAYTEDETRLIRQIQAAVTKARGT